MTIKTPPFGYLIECGRAANNRAIRATKHPIFNLYRLYADPCRGLGCENDQHHHSESAVGDWIALILFIFGVVSISIFCCRFLWVPLIYRVYTSLILAGSILFAVFHVYNFAKWRVHDEALKELREPLLRRTSGDFLVAELERIINERAEQLFGEGTEFAVWLAMLEKCACEVGPKEPEVVREDKGEWAGFREPAATIRTRIIADGADVSSALAALRAFKKGADEKLDELRRRARGLKIPADGLDRIRDALGAGTVREDITTLEAVIQEAVDGIFVALADLAQRVPQAVQAAARATTVGYTDAVRRTAPEIVEVEAGAASRASNRTKGS